MYVKHHFQVCRCSTLDVYAVTVLYSNKIFTFMYQLYFNQKGIHLAVS